MVEGTRPGEADWERRPGLPLISSGKHRRALGRIRAVLSVAAVVTVFGFFAGHVVQNLDMLRQAWQPVSWFHLLLALIVHSASFFLMALLWYGLLRAMGGTLPLPVAIRYYGLTLLPRYVPGMVWGYAGRALLCERQGVPRKVAVGSAVVEVGFLAGSALALTIAKHVGIQWVAAASILGGLPLVRAALPRKRGAQDWESLVHKASAWSVIALAYMAFWLLYGASTWLAALSIAPTLSSAQAIDIVFSAITAWLVGFLVILVPSGLGVREAMLAMSTAPVLGLTGGVFLSLVARLIGFLAELLFSLFSITLGRATLAHDITMQSTLEG